MSEQNKFNYIANSGAAPDVNQTVRELLPDAGTMILMYTDRFEVCDTGDISDIPHLLEARIFSDIAELKIMRPTIADQFSYRLIDDSKLTDKNYIQEEQFLDIDKKVYDKSPDKNTYPTTGGGSFSLPVENACKVVIRNYISFDDEGIARISDFRVVKFLKEGE